MTLCTFISPSESERMHNIAARPTPNDIVIAAKVGMTRLT